MPAYGDLDKALPGLLHGVAPHQIDTGLATAAIGFGAPVFREPGEDDKIRPFVKDEVTLTYSADFVTSNSIAASVNGTAITAVVYATDHATTFAALVAAIDAITGVDIVSSSATARTIRIRTKGVTCTVTSAVTLGASQATVTQKAGTSYVLRGVTCRTLVEAASQTGIIGTPGDGTAGYPATATVNVAVSADLWVMTADAVNSEAQAYLTSTGVWTDDATNNVATPYVFVTSTSEAGLAVLRVSKPVKALA